MPKATVKIYNAYEEFRKQADAQENVSRGEFEKRVNAPSRIDALEGELKNIKGVLNEIVTRLNETRSSK